MPVGENAPDNCVRWLDVPGIPRLMSMGPLLTAIVARPVAALYVPVVGVTVRTEPPDAIVLSKTMV